MERKDRKQIQHTVSWRTNNPFEMQLYQWLWDMGGSENMNAVIIECLLRYMFIMTYRPEFNINIGSVPTVSHNYGQQMPLMESEENLLPSMQGTDDNNQSEDFYEKDIPQGQMTMSSNDIDFNDDDVDVPELFSE